MQNVSILADSLNVETGDRATTFLLHRFPKCLQAELNTHRALSRSSASSRAVPIKKMIERIKADPYIPAFTANKPGMSGDPIDSVKRQMAESIYRAAMDSAISSALWLESEGIHKDMANRLLEPFMRIPIIVTATEWDNFFRLRTAENVQPDFRAVAIEMEQLHAMHSPVEIRTGEWHIPFREADLPSEPISSHPLEAWMVPTQYCLIFSAARCAWISYASHDGDRSFEKAESTHGKLISDGHASPLEHQLMAFNKNATPNMTRNFRGFVPYRHFAEKGIQEEISKSY